MTINHRVLLIVNPISGGIDKSSITKELRERLDPKKAELDIFYTTGIKDKEKATQIIKNYNPNRILIAGGDGSLKLVAEILQEHSIPIGIIPAGSANGLAENLNLPQDLEEIIDVALGEHFVNLDCICINDEFCLHISDIGLNASLIKNYEEGNIRGKFGYLIQSIPTLIKGDFPYNFTIEIDGKTIERQAVLVAIANAQKYGTGAKINPNGTFDDGKFEILIFKKFNISQILKTFQENAVLDADFLEIFSTSEATITCEKKIPFQIDGEYRDEVKTVHAKISPIKIKMAVPKNFRK